MTADLFSDPDALHAKIEALARAAVISLREAVWRTVNSDDPTHRQESAAALMLIVSVAQESIEKTLNTAFALLTAHPVQDEGGCDDLTPSPAGSWTCTLPMGHDGLHVITPPAPVRDKGIISSTRRPLPLP